MHIAIVDSSRVVLKLMTELLERRGHIVESFTDSFEALDFISRTPAVTALITGLEVRPLSGLELCWNARLIGDASRPLCIIVMSSNRNAQSLAEALDSGADDFIEKPPRAEELHARLRVAERLTSMQSMLIQLAETDSLTGLLNRRAFIARAQKAIGAIGGGACLSAILLDIDLFKRINDQYGHDVGDLVIQAVAVLISGVGIAGRLGGEEFALLLPDRSVEEATTIAERLRRRASAVRVPSGNGPVSLSCSFGISGCQVGDTVDSLMKRADVALYEAKASGRNRVMIASDVPSLSETY